MSPAERAHLSAAHNVASQAAHRDDVETYVICNRDFHRLDHAGAHNSSLLTAAQTMQERIAPFSRAQFNVPGRLLQSHAEHEQVVSAIVNSDPTRAADAMRRHVTDVRTTSANFLHKLEINGMKQRASSAA
jgi:DNA-binding GntR family transcriptional regulator